MKYIDLNSKETTGTKTNIIENGDIYQQQLYIYTIEQFKISDQMKNKEFHTVTYNILNLIKKIVETEAKSPNKHS
jgi:hypothetical protein